MILHHHRNMFIKITTLAFAPTSLAPPWRGLQFPAGHVRFGNLQRELAAKPLSTASSDAGDARSYDHLGHTEAEIRGPRECICTELRPKERPEPDGPGGSRCSASRRTVPSA